MAQDPSAKTDVVTDVEKGAGFFARHIKLIIFIGLVVLLAPFVTAIIQIVVGVARGVGAMGKSLSNLFGPVASYVSQMGKNCQDHPGSWDCWLLVLAVGILPVFKLFISSWRDGKFQKTIDAIAELTARKSDDVAKDLATKTRDDFEERIKGLPDEEQKRAQTDLLDMIVTRLGAKNVKDMLSTAQSQSSIAQAEKDEQQKNAAAETRAATDDSNEGKSGTDQKEADDIAEGLR
jgi:hypothetical protein